MPTILVIQGFRVMIRTLDHGRVGDLDNPAHVHVLYGRGQAKLSIGDEGIHPRVLRSEEMTSQDLARAQAIVEANQGWLITNWRRIHGP